ncbi:MAG: GWxTD domain-containing protein [Acidobacteria bacterium]|nr:GWxTD domain-containing protein [Acidobacteriota bacterium]MBE3130717.1 GWxTD domain-containing protein [Acidobacteriota bacterium]
MATKKIFILFAFLAGMALVATRASGAKVKLDPESDKFFRTARLIMVKEEIKIFNRLPDAASRKEFIADFWLKRDPDPATPVNEFKQEFETRVDYATKRFKEGGPGYNTDRGRVFIFMGPPDKVEESFPQGDPDNRGSIIWWIYYTYQLGIEFADEKGNGKYKIRDFDGDFFGAMDLMKVGQSIRTSDVFKKKFVKFEAGYDPASREIEVRIPANALMFRENDEGRLAVDLIFVIYVYSDGGAGKETFRETRSVVTTEGELDGLKTVNLKFAHPLKAGTNFVDVIIQGREATSGKVRRIFEIKVAG